MCRPLARALSLGHRLLRLEMGLDLVVAGLVSSFLTTAVVTLIPTTWTTDAGFSLTCIAYQIGSPHVATTRIHLENLGPSVTRVRFEFVDESGLHRIRDSFERTLAPWASEDVEFRTPALGAVVKLIYPGTRLHLGAVLIRDDEAPPEFRKPIPCLA